MSAEEFREPAAALTELRARLEAARIAKRLAKSALAGLAGLGRTTVSAAFSCSAPPPSAETVYAVARTLGLQPRPLMELHALATRAAGVPSASVTQAAGLPAAGRSAAGLPAAGPRPVRAGHQPDHADEREAARADERPVVGVVGRPIAQCRPHDLGVHPAVDAPRHASDYHSPRRTDRQPRTEPRLPGYVRRPHDAALADLVAAAAAGRSRMAVLVGSSSTGKTRACWEAVQPLAEQGWLVWDPRYPSHPEAALAQTERVVPHTVVWLNEAQHYLGAGSGTGERLAAALHLLLTDPARAPVLVLGTLWSSYSRAYCVLPGSVGPDPHPQARQLLADRQIVLPDAFDRKSIKAAEALAAAGDEQLAHALQHAGDGRLAQFLAGAPELLRRYRSASPPARALLQAAMDARRLGVGLHVPLAFLVEAAEDYLTDDERDALEDHWFEQALADTGEPVHGNLAPLRRARPRTVREGPDGTGGPGGSPAVNGPPAPACRLADYLEQHGAGARRRLCPPTSFWAAAHEHLGDPDELRLLARAAGHRDRALWARRLLARAVEAGSTESLSRLAEQFEQSGDRAAAETLYLRAAEAGDRDGLLRLARERERAGRCEEAERFARQGIDANRGFVLYELAMLRAERGGPAGCEDLLRQAAAAGHDYALEKLAVSRERAGDLAEALVLARLAADSDQPGVLRRLAMDREFAGDLTTAEALFCEAADAGCTYSLYSLIALREKAGDRAEAERLVRQAADAGDTDALRRLAAVRKAAGDVVAAENLFREAADAGSVAALDGMALLREDLGDHVGAEHYAQRAADAGMTYSLFRLAEKRKKAGDRDRAEELVLRAARVESVRTRALQEIALLREETGDRDGAERAARQAAEAGSTQALVELADMRERASGRCGGDGAEELFEEAAAEGDPYALGRLVRMREEAGNHEEADRLAQQAADGGDTAARKLLDGLRAKRKRRRGRPSLSEIA
ncbi:transcriptional regulator [Streptomyces sp. DSM 41987]|uniref:transcriptional regulator n=1 Tax=Streptomyces TaxID=1883 RepID=UPI0018E046FA|nr:transcriptional regulator [Streptomyces fildesensis]